MPKKFSELEQRLASNELTEADKEEMLSWKVTPKGFLREAQFKTGTVDLSFLKNVEVIEEYFCCDAKNLRTVDFSEMVNVRWIGKFFLYCCSMLTALDLSPFSKLTRTEEFFICWCTMLESLKGLPSSLEFISQNCFWGCAKLCEREEMDRVVDLRPLIGMPSENIQDAPLRLAVQRVRTREHKWEAKKIVFRIREFGKGKLGHGFQAWSIMQVTALYIK